MEEIEKRDEQPINENHENSTNSNRNNSSNERKEKRKTWAYVKGDAAKKLNMLLTIASLGTGLVVLLMFFLSCVRVDDVSFGNYFSFAKIELNSYLSNISFLSIEAEYSELYLATLPNASINSLMLVIIDLLLIYRGIKYGIAFLNGSDVCIKKKITKPRLILHIALSSLFVLSVIIFSLIDKALYSCKADGMIVITLLLALAPIATMFIKREYIKNAEGVTKEKVHYLTVEKSNKEGENRIIEQKDLIELSSFEWILNFLVFAGMVISISFSNGWFGYDSYPPDGYFGDYFDVGEEKKFDNPSYFVDGEEIAILDFGYTEELKDQYYIEWGKALYFYSYYIKELEDEIEQLSVQDMINDGESEEEAILLYEKEIKEKEHKIAVLKKAISDSPIPLQTIRTKKADDENYVVTEYVYNTNRTDKTKYKFGDSQFSMTTLAKESLSLDKTSFAEGTNFSTETIVATITYADASIKKVIITPDNIDELNGAARGAHILKWSDSWGEYEVEITIY